MFFKRLDLLRRTLRFRLMLWNAGAVFLTGALTLAGVREGARISLIREMDQILIEDLREIQIAAPALDFPRSKALFDELNRKAQGHSQHDWFVRFFGAQGEEVWTSINAPPASLPVNRLTDWTPVTAGDLRLVQYRDLAIGPSPYTVRVGASLDFVQSDMRRIDRLVAFTAGIVLFVSPLTGYILAGRATRPIAESIQTTARLRPRQLNERLPIRQTGDELDQLARTVNGLLDRIASYLAQRHDFLANAAHELRTPLAAIRSSIEVALNGARSREEYEELLAELLDQCSLLESLVNQLLLLAETDSDRMQIHGQFIDLARVVARSVEMFQAVAESRKIRLLSSAPHTVIVEGNRHHLHQVLNNLIDNAIKYTPENGVIRVTLDVEERSQIAELRVSDTGVGISKEDLPRLFERFFRTDRSRARDDTTGVGLGLSICEAVVLAHGGKINVSSWPGEGTTFTVQLPLAKAPDGGAILSPTPPANG